MAGRSVEHCSMPALQPIGPDSTARDTKAAPTILEASGLFASGQAAQVLQIMLVGMRTTANAQPPCVLGQPYAHQTAMPLAAAATEPGPNALAPSRITSRVLPAKEPRTLWHQRRHPKPETRTERPRRHRTLPALSGVARTS